MDRLMRAQGSATDDKVRKKAFDRVQEIVADQLPFIYLVNKNALVGISPLLQGVEPVATRPQTYWNIERIRFSPERASNAAVRAAPGQAPSGLSEQAFCPARRRVLYQDRRGTGVGRRKRLGEKHNCDGVAAILGGKEAVQWSNHSGWPRPDAALGERNGAIAGFGSV